MATSQDPKGYYSLLEVSPTSSEEEITRAYKKKVLKYHPDSGSEAVKAKRLTDPAQREARLKELTEVASKLNQAREVLLDKKKREAYDHGVDSESFAQGGGFNMADIFFGGQQQRGVEDTSVEVTLSLKEAFMGATKQFKVGRTVCCRTCRGAGGTDLRTCDNCKGTGKVHAVKYLMGQIPVRSETICDHCDGAKRIAKNKCNTCGGKRVSEVDESVEVKIPAGVVTGNVMQMQGRGDETPDGEVGNLNFVLTVKDDPRFKRVGNHLVSIQAVELGVAIKGGFFRFEHIDGRVFKVKIGRVENTRLAIRIKDEGFAERGKGGDLYILPHYLLPKNGTIDLNIDSSFQGEVKNGLFETEPKPSEHKQRRERRGGFEDVFRSFGGGASGFSFGFGM